MASSAGSIAARWPELQGEHSWNGLLDPLDVDLRESVISYGELVQATGDGFDAETGRCLYGYTDLLTRTGVAAAGHYTVTKFVYATEKTPISGMNPAWIGYVAVATDEGVAALGRRDIVVAWRGSVTWLEWINDAFVTLVPAAPVLGAEEFPDAKVHQGFHSLYTSSNADSKLNKVSARDQVLTEVGRLVEMYKDEPASITVTGHSLGASLAMLNAVDIVANGWNTPVTPSLQPPCLVTAIVFACPRVGNGSFKSAFDSFDGLRALHVRNANDVVPDHPSMDRGYVDMGVVLSIDTALSPYLKEPTKTTAHNLECYLHGVAGEQGAGGGFKLVVNRNVALVNKDAHALKDGYPVPARWWALLTGFMLMNAPGKWELKDFNEIIPADGMISNLD
ncbi:hypothetical protein BS78_09G014300 [Paspalum vaginatum]|nr:hypothetical protein BS78_09G014300 [Paspalum vaginatum]